jgi:hypothetical protein
MYADGTKIAEEVDDELRDGRGGLSVSGDRNAQARVDTVRMYPAPFEVEASRRSQQR